MTSVALQATRNGPTQNTIAGVDPVLFGVFVALMSLGLVLSLIHI